MEDYVLIGSAAIAALFLLIWMRSGWKARALRRRRAGITSIDIETKRLKQGSEELKGAYETASRTYSALRQIQVLHSPALEAAIHRELDHYRVNLVDSRKDFFGAAAPGGGARAAERVNVTDPSFRAILEAG